MTEIENGSFVRPSESRKRQLSKHRSPRLSLCQVISEFLDETRKIRGKQTADTYKSRLMPVLDFAEQTVHQRRWPLAMDIDRDFVIALRTFLFNHQTSRNGRPSKTTKTLSVRQVTNV